MTEHFWIIPMSIVLIFIGFLALVADNYKYLRGKDGLSKQDGWLAVYDDMKFVVEAVAWLAAVCLVCCDLT